MLKKAGPHLYHFCYCGIRRHHLGLALLLELSGDLAVGLVLCGPGALPAAGCQTRQVAGRLGHPGTETGG